MIVLRMPSHWRVEYRGGSWIITAREGEIDYISLTEQEPTQADLEALGQRIKADHDKRMAEHWAAYDRWAKEQIRRQEAQRLQAAAEAEAKRALRHERNRRWFGWLIGKRAA